MSVQAGRRQRVQRGEYRTLTPAQVAALNIPQVEGGMLGLNLQKDNALYSLAIRPLLPDEPS